MISPLFAKRDIHVKAQYDPFDAEWWKYYGRGSNVSNHCCKLVYQGPCPLSSSICDDACKRSLVVSCKIRVLFPVSRFLSVPIELAPELACAKHGYGSINIRSC